jgi:hypothetical protein
VSETYLKERKLLFDIGDAAKESKNIERALWE